jgi:hypothetical protein
MQEILIQKLLLYMQDNNPELLLQLEEKSRVTDYLLSKVGMVDCLINEWDEDQPAYILETACMDILTQDLRPSKYQYICKILEEEFEDYYEKLDATGLKKLEAINLLESCKQVFDDFGFDEESEDNRLLRYLVMGSMSEYFENGSSEKSVGGGVQDSTKITG